ncbi:hypothetical protein ACNAW0_22695 [Micromonospora sp. SL1-18]|uniref:hypothetical protein n=1 Tax=Micromonospora sp. SL1-18 TaxID=3399128 RepID=UPI003A4E107C
MASPVPAGTGASWGDGLGRTTGTAGGGEPGEPVGMGSGLVLLGGSLAGSE